MTAEDMLAGLLAHYFEQAWRAAGLDWGTDNRMEVDRMAELIVGIARQESSIATARNGDDD